MGFINPTYFCVRSITSLITNMSKLIMILHSRNCYVTIPLVNVALKKPSWQSSTDYNWTANRANDGNRTNVQDMKKNSCSHTAAPKKGEPQITEAWWQVDLQKTAEVREVILTTRHWGKKMCDSIDSIFSF